VWPLVPGQPVPCAGQFCVRGVEGIFSLDQVRPRHPDIHGRRNHIVIREWHLANSLTNSRVRIIVAIILPKRPHHCHVNEQSKCCGDNAITKMCAGKFHNFKP
jgi:hypothetical protein